jgi:dynein heavy chain
MASGKSASGANKPLAAFAFRPSDGHWHDCQVAAYDDETRLFTVRFSDGVMIESSKLHVLFVGEDPEQHAQRVRAAVDARLESQARAKFNFVVDNMPVDGLAVLDVDKVARILDLARNTAVYRDAAYENVVDESVKEINLDFGRTMNKIGFNGQCADADEVSDTVKHLLETLGVRVPDDEMMLTTLGIRPEQKPVRDSALVDDCPPYNFTGLFSDFCFSSLYVQPIVISTAVATRTSCLELLARECLYSMSFPRAMRCDQFRTQQKTHGTQTLAKLRDQWVVSLQKLIATKFAGIGKGWFNIAETSQETYLHGKLRKLLTVVKLLMQDTVRDLALNSTEEYVKVMMSFMPGETKVNSLFDVTLSYPNLGADDELPSSLFLLEVKKAEEEIIKLVPQKPPEEDPKDKKKRKNSKDPPVELPPLEVKETIVSFAYNTPPQEFVDAVVEAYSFGLQQLTDIPQLERLIMPQLFRTSMGKQVLASPLPDEGWLVERKGKLEAGYTANLGPLADYLGLFDAQLDRLKIDVAEWMKEKNDDDNPAGVEELRKDLEKHLEEEKVTSNAIPESKKVGVFDISMADIRKTLIGKHSKIADAAQELLIKRYREMAQDVTRAYQAIVTRLQKEPSGDNRMEELTELKEFLATVPSELQKLELESKQVLKTFSLLEHYRMKTVPDDTHQRYRVYGGPKMVLEQIEKSEENWRKLEKSFMEEMAEDQDDFAERMRDLQQTIQGFTVYSDLEKIDEYYENVEFVNEKLKIADGEAKLFNARETMFGAENTDYSFVNVMKKQWEPFSNLWTIAKNWLSKKGDWLHGPFDKLDAKDVEALISNGVRALFKVVKDFKTLPPEETAAVLSVAEKIKTELDEFKPYVPLVVGLRNPGMRDRHWEQVTEMVGKEGVVVSPKMEEFCLQKFIDLGMVEQVEQLADIGDRSGKEFQIEKQLNAMKELWSPVMFDVSEQYRTTETWILKGSDEVTALLDEQIVVTQAMQFSPFKKPFEEEIEEWATQLMYVSETLENWLKVQRGWMYLQPIFDSPDIVKQLPLEAKKFKSVDTGWRGQMFKVSKDPTCLTQLSVEGLLEKWIIADRDLEAVQNLVERFGIELKPDFSAKINHQT